MPTQNKKSRIVTVRLPLEVVQTIERRITGQKGRHSGISSYLRERITYDTMRRHKQKPKSS